MSVYLYQISSGEKRAVPNLIYADKMIVEKGSVVELGGHKVQLYHVIVADEIYSNVISIEVK